ncbi:MAG: hypothetical protein ACI8PZ_002354 [Myxococcota bacterium]|jgi:hypothetical protein
MGATGVTSSGRGGHECMRMHMYAHVLEVPVRTILLILVFSACGESDSEFPEPVDLTDTTPVVTTGSDPATVDTGWACNEWYPCQDCGGEFCGAEIGTCAGNGTCGAALNAWAGCVLDCGDPVVCAGTFDATGGAAAEVLLSCTEASCAEVCGL